MVNDKVYSIVNVPLLGSRQSTAKTPSDSSQASQNEVRRQRGQRLDSKWRRTLSHNAGIGLSAARRDIIKCSNAEVREVREKRRTTTGSV